MITFRTIITLHLEPCQTRYRDMISRYRYIPILNPISGTILQIPDIGYPDIGTYPISGIPISGHTRYRVYLISGMSRYRDQYRDKLISGPNVTISSHSVSRYRTRCLLFPAGLGPKAGAGFPAAAACS